jgi:hypothetical protein
MVEEYDSIVRNDVWDVVPTPMGKSVVTSRWLYKTKIVADGSVEKHKPRFVAQGFSQIEGVNYDETFAPVARYTSIRSQDYHCHSSREGLTHSSDGCENRISEWLY